MSKSPKKSKFVEDVPRLERYRGGELPPGWQEFTDSTPNPNKARSKTSWLYNVKKSYATMSEVNAMILDLRRSMLKAFREVLQVYPPTERYIVCEAVHLQASYRLDPKDAKAENVWPLELQPDDGEMFLAPNGGFMWLTTPYPDPHPQFSGTKQSHIEIYGTEFHAAVKRHMPQILRDAPMIKQS